MTRGQMIPKGQNKWLLRVYTGRVDGKKTYASETFHGTTSDARKALTKLHTAKDTHTLVRPGKLTVKEFLKQWLAGKRSITEGTRVSYERMIGYVNKSIGNLRLCELQKAGVESLVGVLIADGLSPRTIEYIHRVLHTALESAISQRLIVLNPAGKVELPKKLKRPPTVLSNEQVALFLETADAVKDPYACFFRVGFTTGMRPQETGGLKWSALDLFNGWASIVRVLQDNGKGKQFIAETTKGGNAAGKVALPKSTVAALLVHKKEQNADILKMGKDYHRLDLVFATPHGLPLDLNNVRRHFKAVLKAAKLPAIRFYDMRHSHATALLAGGADLAWVSSRLRHSNIKTTADHYAHVLPETHREMADRTENMLTFPPTKTKEA